MPTRPYAFILSLLLLAGPLTAPAEPANGLQMTLRLEEPADTRPAVPTFRLDFHNTGSADLVLNVGVMLANGKRQYPNAVVLILTDPGGKSRQLNMIQPAYVAGRVDPMVLPLPVGATFSVPLDLKNYWAAESGEFEFELKPGTYTIEAQLSWPQGTLSSNPLRFYVVAH